MTVKQLREKAAVEAEAARAIKDQADQEARGLTQEEADKLDSHLNEAIRLEKEADRQQRLEETEARLNEPQKRQTTTETADGSRIEIVKPDLFRFSQLRAFKGPKAEANAYKVGKFLLATIMNNAEARQWCRDHNVEIRESRVMTESVNSAGGFVVPDEMERAIIDLREVYGNARRNCRIVTMSSDHIVTPRKSGGLTAYPIGEKSSITESEQTWNQVELTAKKWGVLTRMSTDLTDDAIINMADDITNDVAMAFSTAEDTTCIDGDGTGTYHGIIGIRPKMIDGNHAGSYVEAVAPGDNWSEIDEADLLAVQGAMPVYAKIGAKWHCSPTCKVAVFDRLLRAAGGNTNQNLAQGQPAQYNGYPIEEWPAMPSIDAAAALNDKIMLLFGNMRMSTSFGDRRGITLKISSDRYLEYDQIGIMATSRWTINHHDIGGAAAVRGPVVGLLGTT